MPKLVSLEYAGAYAIKVRFADGVEGEIDLARNLYGEMFEPLSDSQLFAQFRLDPDTRTIVWPNGADLAPEFVRQMVRAPAQSDSLSPEHLAAIRRAAPKAKGKIIFSLI